MSVAETINARRRLQISDPRQTSLEVHAHLRDLIVSGALPAGTELKQAQLARLFGVSRAPLREAFRMLQEERLISAQPNQRGRVTAFDASELDMLYAGRIVLEALGARLSTGNLTDAETRRAAGALREMERTYRIDDLAGWSTAHQSFHLTIVSRCGPDVLRTVSSYAARSERYVRAYQNSHPDSFPQRHEEHVALLEAVRGENPATTVALIAAHLAGTAVRVIDDFAPDHTAGLVREAVSLVGGETSEA